MPNTTAQRHWAKRHMMEPPPGMGALLWEAWAGQLQLRMKMCLCCAGRTSMHRCHVARAQRTHMVHAP
eukprot:1936018-Lingulodinium_polyedra.AAC.1